MSFTAVYVRISDASQNAASQKRELETWLNGHSIDRSKVKWYIDTACGDNLQRPEFKKMQRDIFGGIVHTVIVWKLDRLSRSLKDGIDIVCSWCEQGIRLVSTSQMIDFSGQVGKIIAAVLLGFAELEQETRRERQAAGIKVAKEKGVYTGRKPGAVKAGVDPKRAVELREKGQTQEEIARALGVSVSSVRRYLRSA